MITSIEGILAESGPLHAVIETHGIGYYVHVPLTTAEHLPPSGKTVRLHTVVVYREDAQNLYGFLNRNDRALFLLLIEKVSGIGPKLALTILSKMSATTLEHAIAQGDIPLLCRCPGIGKKTAERLVIELRDKLTPAAAAPSAAASPPQATAAADAVAALVALGYKLPDADSAIRKAASTLGENATTEALIRRALA